MRSLLAMLAVLVAVPLWDWAAMSRIGIYAFNCDYRWWPLSKARAVSVILLTAAVAFMVLVSMRPPGEPPHWLLWVGLSALAVWGAVALMDFLAQNRRGYRAPPPPPRYSDPRF